MCYMDSSDEKLFQCDCVSNVDYSSEKVQRKERWLEDQVEVDELGERIRQLCSAMDGRWLS